jgi:hypothetical protein
MSRGRVGIGSCRSSPFVPAFVFAVRENVFDVRGLIFVIHEADHSIVVSGDIKDVYRVALVVAGNIHDEGLTECGKVRVIVAAQGVVPLAQGGFTFGVLLDEIADGAWRDHIHKSILC